MIIFNRERLCLFLALFKTGYGILTEPGAQKPLNGDAETGRLSWTTNGLEDFVETMMKKWHVPGLALSIIDGNDTWSKVFIVISLCVPFLCREVGTRSDRRSVYLDLHR